MRLIRRINWYISTYLKRYTPLIIVGLITSFILAFVLKLTFKYILQIKPTVYVGIVGNFTGQDLPPLVKKTINAGLTRVDEQGNIIPNLASTWQTQNNGKTYIVKLNPSLAWPDNNPVIASQINLNIPNVIIDFPDNNTIKFNLPETFSPFPSILTYPIINTKGQTSTGFSLSLTQSRSAQTKNIQIESKNKIIQINIYDSVSLATTAFKLGKIDIIYGINQTPNIKPSPTLKIETKTNYDQIATLFFNTHDPVLADKNIRQGIAYAIKEKTPGDPFNRAITSIHPYSWAYNHLVKTYDFNPNKARSLISKNLNKSQLPLRLELTTQTQYIEFAQNLKNQLANQNIELTIKVTNNVPDNYQLFLGTFNIPIDPDQYQLWHSTQKGNISKIKDAKIDKFLEDGRTTLDQKKRKQIYLEFQKSLLEKLPALFLFHPLEYNVYRNEAKI